jgi:O-antigen/teichoic acid export membrane protein
VSAPASPRAVGTFRLADGVVRGFAAELLLLPTGLVTAAVLTRVLGPEGYGLFSLAATFIGWMAWTTTALLARAAVKLVSEAEDWTPVASSVLR